MPLDDLLISLEGWREYLILCSTIYIRKSLNCKPLLTETKISFRVRRIAPEKSIEAILEFVGLAMITGVIGNQTNDIVTHLAKNLWKWCAELFNTHIEYKRKHMSIEEAVAALEKLAEKSEIIVDKESEPSAIVQLIDDALQKAVVPVDNSAERISLESNASNERISATSEEKKAIDSEFNPTPTPIVTTQPIQVKVRFTRININNQTASIKFVNPTEPAQKGIRSCHIVDKSTLKKARDPYTKSLHLRKPLSVWAQKVILNTETDAIRWEISTKPPPPPDLLLFETNEYKD